ncbi:pyruvate, water dikinase regulatory protein [Xylanimonas protaetiae]|uniref:Putative pyruvate, phosphate dikinase regulatory protein n=1 Tax=Xylanimonas protaetiae TaxID=2509457 RepID=A0A4P6F3V9_9MICO|nr:pyruvate, water dikinase regulatory protein [Xylanimonas protaetiae]QAY69363.1 kinase/pyrophosphorylase [Xylanimonas protaetiae]
MAAPERVVDIHVVADSTGDTGARVARAVGAQYPDLEVNVVRHPRIHDVDGVDRALETLREDHADAVVFVTLVDVGLNARVAATCAELGVPCADLMAPALDAVIARTGLHPARVVQPVGLAADYFERIHAMEFAVANDDGNLTDSLSEADVVLVGASRTGKTPLSMYLGYLGYRTANVPLVTGVAPPDELFQAAPWKIVGLTIDPERLLAIRRRRVSLMGAQAQDGGRLGGYADLARIFDELDDVARIQRRLGCPVLDTTSLALEEAAGRVIELVSARRRAHLAAPTPMEGPVG